MICEANDCLDEYKESINVLNEVQYGYLIINNSPHLQHRYLRICHNFFEEDPDCKYPKFTVV